MSSHPVGGLGVDTAVPPPPPGPGVVPPFAAPPTDKSRRGLWIGLGVGALVLVLCCAGGLFGIGLLVVGGIEQSKRQATAVVTGYLDAVREGDYEQAHDYYCADLAGRISREELADAAEREPFTSYQLDEPRFSEFLQVTAHLSGGAAQFTKTFLLDTEGQQLRICNIE